MSEYDQLLDQVRRAGATVSRRDSGHYKIEKDGQVVFCASTPSDVRATDNLRAELRRRGILPKMRPGMKSTALTRTEFTFMDRFTGTDPLILGPEEIVPHRLIDRDLVRVANRYRHGKLAGKSVWLTQLGVETLEANR